MALSQVQCLDDNHVNWPSQESKPEFLYSEDQRLAVEALINGGRKAFQECMQEHGVRPFLSELEQNQLMGAETYQPESEGDGVEGCENGAESSNDTESLQYWPDRSEDSIPELDIGWPERVSYRGVTRVSVYTQPPMEGQTHIKEIVRKTISMAQRVIAVAMDLFTDADIFKDLLDASFKRKVSVYIVLEATGVPHFLDMCERVAMHRGHLKNLRVRCTRGIGFCTHSLRKVRGQLSQKFMFVDGDRAVSGSYSYTWMASRMDRNLITVLTGQTVETFDMHFRELYLQSERVNLSEISLGAEPEPEPAPRLVAPPTLPAARKLVNRFYTLVCPDMDNANSSGTQDAAAVSSEASGAKTNGCPEPEVKVPQLREEAPDWPPLHPGLVGLEPVDMFDYLPTWPDPEPAKNVIGYINVRDGNRAPQSHLMRSEQFETSQPISFKDPLILPEEPLPEKACPRSKLRNPRTPNGPIASEPPGGQREGKEVPGTSETPEELSDNLTSAVHLCTTDAPGVKGKSKDVSSIPPKSEERRKNIETSNSTSTKDAKGVTKEAMEVPSVSATSKERQENLGTPNGPGAKDTQRVPEEGKGVPGMPVISEEHQENPESALPVSNGPVQPEVHRQTNDITAQASQPMAGQQEQKQPHPQEADTVLPTSTERKQEKEQTDRQKVTQTASSNPSHQQRNQAQVPVKTSNPRLDGRGHPPNLAGAMTGGHTLWQGQQLAQGRAGRGDPSPRDQPYGRRGSLSSQHSQTYRPPQPQLNRARPGHQAPAAHRPLGTHGESRNPPGQLFTRHSHLRTMNGAVPETQMAAHRRTHHRQPGPGAAPGHRQGYQQGHHRYPTAMYNH